MDEAFMEMSSNSIWRLLLSLHTNALGEGRNVIDPVLYLIVRNVDKISYYNDGRIIKGVDWAIEKTTLPYVPRTKRLININTGSGIKINW